MAFRYTFPMSESQPFINMHCVYEALDGLMNRQEGELHIDLNGAPHTQEGQQVGVNFGRVEIVDVYRNTLREIAQEQLDKDVQFEEVIDGPEVYEYRVWVR